MPRYIDTDDAIKHLRGACIAKYPLSFSYGIFASADEINKLPTADVVPKSEVERLQAEVERLRKDNEYILMQHRFQRRPSGDCWNDVIEKAKADVAREIFEELRKEANLRFDGFRNTIIFPLKYYHELKKKYTESCTDCQHFVGCEKAVWTGPCEEHTENESTKNEKGVK